MTEFLFKRTDYTHADQDKDRRGVHKKTDFINHKPDGWSDHPNWAVSSYPKDFIVIKVPGITFSEVEANDHRKSWRDDLDYEITATRLAQRQYDIADHRPKINQQSVEQRGGRHEQQPFWGFVFRRPWIPWWPQTRTVIWFSYKAN